MYIRIVNILYYNYSKSRRKTNQMQLYVQLNQVVVLIQVKFMIIIEAENFIIGFMTCTSDVQNVLVIYYVLRIVNFRS